MKYSVLDRIEVAGNRLPHPTVLFVILCFAVLLLSWLAALAGLKAAHPHSGEVIRAVNLLSATGLHRMLSETVTNFTSFAPVGTVLVAIMGIGVAEHSGLLGALLRATVLKAPARLLSFVIVFTGVLSSLAADTGYVVLVPLAALIFKSAGRNPLAGIAAAFAGVSGGYSANLLIGPLDAILAGISTEAAVLVQPGYEVNAAGNYYFMLSSVFVISLVGAWITERIILPRMSADNRSGKNEETGIAPLSVRDQAGLKAVTAYTFVVIVLLLAGLVPEAGILRDPESGSIIRSPFINGIVVIIAVYAALAGILFGRVSGRYRRAGEFVGGMEQHMAVMAGYLVLMFFAAQFVSYFSWSNLGSIIAVGGAGMLAVLQIPPAILLLVFIPLAAFINLFIGSASAKWALIAPVFVPMLLLSGISPEATQIAYRIGDSTTNIITPLMPYFGVIIAFARQYDKSAGIGTVIAMMLPYSVGFLLAWSVLLVLWILSGWQLGPGADIFL